MDNRKKADEALRILGDAVWSRFADTLEAMEAAEARAARESERVYAKGKTLLVVRRGTK